MKTRTFFTILFLMLLFPPAGNSQEDDKKPAGLNKATFSGLSFRNIGPAFMSGRIADIAIHPENPNIWYVAVGSGGVWKTTNSGVTWNSIFDKQPVYSIGCISIDPTNPHTIWVGTGENVGGRHVSFGNGVYCSHDDGKTWQHKGLENSEHISEIIVHPQNPDIVFVASQGPLWSEGGQRGFYKTTDAGKTWQQTLGDKQWTGVTDIALDPRNPERIYAATWQRHRTVAAYMGGGEKTALYRSENGGDDWKKLSTGLPKKPKGKIGLAVSPQKPDVIYAAIELERRKGAVYKSENRGESWKKQSETVSGGTGPHYYQELYACPHQFDRLYLADVRMKVSDNGGKSFRSMSEKHKHSDNHALAFRQSDPNYLLVGTDGGLYETFDLRKNWRFINNLPVTQFYKVALDDSEPFYWVYGGTQDNNTQGGPSRTDTRHGIRNSDWEVVLFADGHQPATEPGNPDIMYAEWQEGNLVRIDRSTGEIVYIQPQPRQGESYERFNWDAPILVSPHSPTRLYYASHRIWRSDNRGDLWNPISGDLTQYEERFDMPIMGKKQSWDAPWDVYAMSTYNTITSLAESPKQEGLIYAGTDDGLIQVTENGGETWRKIPVSQLPGVPAKAFVNDIKADLHDPNTVFVCLDNHKYGDFKPYIYKSTDRGKTWKSIAANLPEPLLIWRMVQDHKNPALLFAGTEFGIYFSPNGGKKWIKMNTKANISFRDLAIQRRENDLVGASFGRGFFILDDYSALRNISAEKLKNNKALLFAPRKAWWYIQRGPLGGSAKGSQGASLFTAPNPPFGAVFTYYLRDGLKSLKQTRQEKEKKLKKNNQDIDFPGWNALDKEIMQENPMILLTVLDKNNQTVKKIKGKTSKGIHRISWDLTFTSPAPLRLNQKPPQGGAFMVAPGTYKAFLSQKTNGVLTILSDTVEFEVEQLRKGALKGAPPEKVAAFWKEIADFQAEVSAFFVQFGKTKAKAQAMQQAVLRSENPDTALIRQIHDFGQQILELERKLRGSPAKRQVGEKYAPTIMQRIRVVVRGVQNATYGPTPTHTSTLALARKEYKALLETYKKLTETEQPKLENALQRAGAPYIED